jgi:hypothetical protein
MPKGCVGFTGETSALGLEAEGLDQPRCERDDSSNPTVCSEAQESKASFSANSGAPSAVPYADFADPQSLNLYTYVRNIPTTRFDPDGHIAGDDEGGFFDAAKQWLHNLFQSATSAKNTDPTADSSPPVLPATDTTTHQIVTTTTHDLNQFMEVTNDVIAPLDPMGTAAIANATVHEDKAGLALAAAGPVLEAGKLLGPIEKTAVIAEKTAQADTLYPKLAGKVHDHHVIPIYLGGAKNGETASVPASYHQ